MVTKKKTRLSKFLGNVKGVYVSSKGAVKTETKDALKEIVKVVGKDYKKVEYKKRKVSDIRDQLGYGFAINKKRLNLKWL